MATNPISERDQELDDWQRHTETSIVAENRKRKLTGIGLAVVVVIMLAGVYFLKGGKSATHTTVADTHLTVASRKVVQPLKETIAAEVPPVAPVATPAVPSTDSLQIQREQIELQRKEKALLLLQARLKSAIVPSGGHTQADPAATPVDGQGDGNPPSLLNGAGNVSERGAQDANSRFARSVSGNAVAISEASDIANLEYKILQGKVIEAIIVPRAKSDLPGTICATVQRDVYAARGRLKLIPWGSSMCGIYSAELRKGQDRIFSIWNTLRTSNPDGSITEITLDSIGSDQLGTSGMGGIVDTHFAEIFGTSALLSIIGAGAANAGVNSNDQNNSAAQYRESVQQAAAQTSQSVLAPYINMPPTITVPAGSRIRIFVNRHLDFTQVYKKQIEAARQQDSITVIN